LSFLKQNIKQASIIIAVFTVLSQAVGIIRESIIASYFGTSAELDILLMALAIPLMFSSILFWAIPSAGIPYLQEADYGMTASRRILKTSFFKINTLVILGLSILIFVFLPLLRNILAGNLPAGQADLVIKYGRLFCLLVPFKAYEAVFRAILHIKHHFIFPTVTNLGFNVAVIVILITLYPSLASRAFIAAWLVGTFLQVLLVTIPAFVIYNQNDGIKSDNTFKYKAYIKYFWIIVLIDSSGLIIPPFDKYLAGVSLDPGYVSALNYADIVNSVPLRALIFSLGTAIFPTLSEKAAKNEITGLAVVYHKTMAICVMLILPISVFFIIFRHEIIGLLFERGKFVSHSREITVQVLTYYLAGLFFNSAFFIQSKVLYALKLWRMFGFARFFSLAVKCLIGFVLINYNWALAIGGGTVAMFVLSYVMLELYLIFKTGLRYSVSELNLFTKAAVNALAASAIFIAGEVIFGAVINRIALMFIAGAIGFSGLAIMDIINNVSGINFKKMLLKFK
jgi:putative peptidoglycan lipid II flippase